MTPLETILLSFLKKEITTNPQLPGNLLTHVLEQAKVTPDVATELGGLLTQLLPVLVPAS